MTKNLTQALEAAFIEWNDGDQSKGLGDRKRGFEAGYYAARGALHAPALKEGWRTIESAPTWEDGVRVLICGGRFEEAALTRSDGEYWRGDGLENVKPKFWQPAPAPPSEVEEPR